MLDFLRQILSVIMAIIASLMPATGNINQDTPQQAWSTAQPRRTSNWFASAYEFPSYPIFAHPISFKIEGKGVLLSYPNLVATEKTVFASFVPECTIFSSSEITTTKVIGHSAWSLKIKMTGEGFESVGTFTQGSPYVFFETSLGNLTFNCSSERGKNSFAFDDYGFGKTRVTALPSNKTVSESVQSLDWDPIEDTRVYYEEREGRIVTRYQIITKNRSETFTALFPHHVNSLVDNPLFLDTYQTAVGPMKLIRQSEFTTSDPVPSLFEQFELVENEARREEVIAQIKKDIEGYVQETAPGGVYFRGTWIGAATSLVQLADLYGLNSERDKMLEVLVRTMDESFKDIDYDKNKKMMLAKSAEFGHENGNDHHFHWSYYIRAASIISRFNNAWYEDHKGIINNLVSDIATIDPLSTEFPYLRHFSVYEGHSWADGRGQFGDGNNQESTSEALNAWYSIYLWGRVTGDLQRTQQGKWMFTKELSATKAYWFGIGNPFPEGYDHPIASIVWGGKRDFTTWFSADPMHIYGIQWLPITPASDYLSQLSDYRDYEADIKKTQSDPAVHEWGDLYASFYSFHNPNEALGLIPRIKSTNGLKARSILLQTVYRNLEK